MTRVAGTFDDGGYHASRNGDTRLCVRVDCALDRPTAPRSVGAVTSPGNGGRWIMTTLTAPPLEPQPVEPEPATPKPVDPDMPPDPFTEPEPETQPGSPGEPGTPAPPAPPI
jgi:hypothetical protein